MCGDAGSMPASRLYFTTRRRTSDVRRPRPLRESSSGSSRRAAAAVVPRARLRPVPLPLELAAAALEVPAQRGRRLVSERHDALLAALAADDDLGLGRLHVPEPQRHQLHAAQAAPIQQLHDEPVAQRERIRAFGGRDQGVDLAQTQHSREPAAAARAGQAARRVGGEHARLGQESREPAQRRELPRECRRRVPAPAELGGERARPPGARGLRRRGRGRRATRAAAAGPTRTSGASPRTRRAPRGREGTRPAARRDRLAPRRSGSTRVVRNAARAEQSQAPPEAT